jgi:hypothetical protein
MLSPNGISLGFSALSRAYHIFEQCEPPKLAKPPRKNTFTPNTEMSFFYLDM